jgi:hypothetical protein
LHSEEVHNLYTSTNIIRLTKSGEAYNKHRVQENAYKISVGKPERKVPLGKTRHRWEDNIRMDLREIKW